MEQGEKGKEAGAASPLDNYAIITEFVSPLQKQLLRHRIELANTPAEALDPAGRERAFRKLRLLENLVEDEKAKNPYYAVARLVDSEERGLYSCFISYARLNDDFASRLHADLQAEGVTCWKDTRDMKGGDYYRNQINEAIRLRDKLIIICSRESVLREAVIEEIVEGIEQQEKTGIKKLFPIRLDNFIVGDEIIQIGKEKTATGEWPKNWLAKVRAFHIPDFSGWETNSVYQQAFQTLLRDLKASKPM